MYGRRRNAVLALKEELRRRVLVEDATRAVCQLCGFPAPSTFDHFLEKARFPELSLYQRNLIPCCWDCNHGRKPSFDSNGERHLLHFYDDDVDNMPDLLTASVSVPTTTGVPVVTYSVGHSSHPLRDVYENHFSSLNLAQRYRLQAAVEINTFKERARMIARVKLVSVLQIEAAARSKVYGPNDYLAALLRALAASPAALAWLQR
jgi:hypothetical protein